MPVTCRRLWSLLRVSVAARSGGAQCCSVSIPGTYLIRGAFPLGVQPQPECPAESIAGFRRLVAVPGAVVTALPWWKPCWVCVRSREEMGEAQSPPSPWKVLVRAGDPGPSREDEGVAMGSPPLTAGSAVGPWLPRPSSNAPTVSSRQLIPLPDRSSENRLKQQFCNLGQNPGNQRHPEMEQYPRGSCTEIIEGRVCGKNCSRRNHTGGAVACGRRVLSGLARIRAVVYPENGPSWNVLSHRVAGQKFPNILSLTRNSATEELGALIG